MAQFAGISTDVAGLASKCVKMNDRNDIADFLVLQQEMIQSGVIFNRIENKANEAKKQAAGQSAKGSANSAFERMKAMMK